MTDTAELPDLSDHVRGFIGRAETMTSKFPMSEKQGAYALKLVRAMGVDDNDLSTLNSSGASFLIDNLLTFAKPYLDRARRAEDRESSLSDNLTALSVSVGDKARFTGRLDSKRDIYSGFGGTTLLVFTNDKYRVKTFTTRDWVNDLAVGDEVTIVGTVKGVDDFRGATSTLLTRVRVL